MPEDQPLSQEDIDAALAGLGSDESGSPELEAASATDGQASPTEDSSGPQPPAETSTDESTETVADSDAGGAFDQDDIDALINQADTSTDQPDPASAQASEGEVSAASDRAGDVELDSAGRPFDAAAAEMAAAIATEKEADPPPTTTTPEPAAPPPGSEPMSLPDFAAGGTPDESLQLIDLLKDVGLQVKIELGRSHMLVEDVLRLGEGSVVELDKLAGDPVDVYVNDRLVVRGEVLVLNDNFCVRVNEIISDTWKDFQTA